jgi:hypothetical protein
MRSISKLRCAYRILGLARRYRPGAACTGTARLRAGGRRASGVRLGARPKRVRDMRTLLRVMVLVLGLVSLSACERSWGHMDPIKTGGDAPGDITN